jgi:lipopolysaccharide transport system permease protein
VFFPIGAIPEPFRRVVQLNPLALVIENARQSLIWGNLPDLRLLLTLTLVALIFVMAASNFFQKSKPAFADVI